MQSECAVCGVCGVQCAACVVCSVQYAMCMGVHWVCVQWVCVQWVCVQWVGVQWVGVQCMGGPRRVATMFGCGRHVTRSGCSVCWQ